MQLNSSQKKVILKNRLIFFFVLLFVYVILFEFVLPVNKILPKPSLLLESVTALFTDYNLLSQMAITTTIVYLAIPIAFALVWLLSFRFSIMITKNIGFFNNLRLFKYFPTFFFVVLFTFWFQNSLFAELIFAVIISTVHISNSFIKTAGYVPKEYTDSAKSLNIVGKELHKKVIWAYSLPKLITEIKILHYSLWVLLLIYEFVGVNNGFGGIYNLALKYNDLSVFILLAIIIALLIWLGNSIISYIKNKLVFWKV